jgi:hypothetical protein
VGEKTIAGILLNDDDWCESRTITLHKGRIVKLKLPPL